MSTNHSPRATATLLRKLKELASQFQRDDQALARHVALERAARAFGFTDYDRAAHGYRRRAGETSEVDEPLSEQGKKLVDALRAMGGAISNPDQYLQLRLEAIKLWRSMAESGPQSQLCRVQHELGGHLDLCKRYFDVVTAGVETQQQLSRFQYTGAAIINFELPEWNGVAPVAKVEEGPRRRLLNRLKAVCGSKCDVRVSRLAVVTHASVKDVPSDRALFHAARSCFHVYDSFDARSLPVDVREERSATLGVIAMLSVPSGMVRLTEEDFEDMMEEWSGRLEPYEVEAEFVEIEDRRVAGLGSGPGYLDVGLGLPAWRSIGNMYLPSPPGVQERSRTSSDPFVLRLRLDRERQREAGLKEFVVEIAAKHQAGRSSSFMHLGRTAAPAFCVGWCDLYLKTIRGSGEVSEVIVEG